MELEFIHHLADIRLLCLLRGTSKFIDEIRYKGQQTVLLCDLRADLHSKSPLYLEIINWKIF